MDGADQARKALLGLAGLATSAEDRPPPGMIPLDCFYWLPASAVRVFTSPDTDHRGEAIAQQVGRFLASALSRKVRAGGSCGGFGWSAPAVAFLGSDAGSFSSLSGEELRGPRIGVSPAQVGLESGGEHDVVRVVRVVEHELT